MSASAVLSAFPALAARARFARGIGVCVVLIALVFQSAVWASQSCHVLPASPQNGHHTHSHDATSNSAGDHHHSQEPLSTDDSVLFHKCPVCAACCLSVAFSGNADALHPVDYRGPGPGFPITRAPPIPPHDPPFHPPRGALPN